MRGKGRGKWEGERGRMGVTSSAWKCDSQYVRSIRVTTRPGEEGVPRWSSLCIFFFFFLIWWVGWLVDWGRRRWGGEVPCLFFCLFFCFGF